MFKAIFLTILISSNSVMASEKTPIREVKDWSEKTAHEKTCGDEYIQRRKQLGLRMGLTPLIILGGAASGMLAGGFVGFQIYSLGSSSAGGFADLAAFLGGAMIGGTVGTAGTGIGSGITIVNFFKNQNLLRLIYEAQNQGGEALDEFFKKFQEEYPENDMTLDQFKTKISKLDQEGKLCDGSVVNPKRFKKGKKLKQRLATKEEIFHVIALQEHE